MADNTYNIDVSAALAAMQRVADQVADTRRALGKKVGVDIDTKNAQSALKSIAQSAITTAKSVSSIGGGMVLGTGIALAGKAVEALGEGMKAVGEQMLVAGDTARDLNKTLSGVEGIDPISPDAIKNLDSMGAGFQALQLIAKQVLIDILSGFGTSLPDMVTGVIETFVSLRDGIFNVGSVIKTIYNVAVQSFSGTMSAASALKDSILSMVGDVANGISTFLSPVFSFLKDNFEEITRFAIAALTTPLDSMLKTARLISSGLGMDEMTAKIDKASEALQSYQDSAPKELVSFFKNASSAVSNLAFKTTDSAKAAAQLMDIGGKLATANSERGKAAAKAGEDEKKALDGAIKTVIDYMHGTDAVKKAEAERTKIVEAATIALNAHSISQEEYNDAMRNAAKGVQDAKNAQSGYTNAMELYKDLIAAAETKQDKYNKNLQLLNKLNDGSTKGTKMFTEAKKELDKQFHADNVKTYKDVLDSLIYESMTSAEKAAKEYSDVQKEMARVVQEGSKKQEEANIVLDLAAKKYEKTKNGISDMFGALSAGASAAGLGGLSSVLDTVSTLSDKTVSGTDKVIAGISGTMSVISGYVGMIDSLVSAVTGMSLTDLIGSGDKAGKIFTDALAKIDFGKMLENLSVGIVSVFQAISDSADQIFGSIVESILTSLPNIIESLIEPVVNIAKVFVIAIIDQIPALIIPLTDLAFGFVDAIVAALPELFMAITRAMPKVVAAISTIMISKIPEIIADIANQIPLIIEGLVRGFISSIVDGLAVIFEQLGLKGAAEAIRSAADSIATIPEQTPMTLSGAEQAFSASKETATDGFVPASSQPQQVAIPAGDVGIFAQSGGLNDFTAVLKQQLAANQRNNQQNDMMIAILSDMRDRLKQPQASTISPAVKKR